MNFQLNIVVVRKTHGIESWVEIVECLEQFVNASNIQVDLIQERNEQLDNLGHTLDAVSTLKFTLLLCLILSQKNFPLNVNFILCKIEKETSPFW